MEIRAATLDDAGAIAALNAETWRAAFRGVVADSYIDRYDGKLHRRMESLGSPRPGDQNLVAVESGSIIGWVSGRGTLVESVYELSACYVLPAHWRTGIGRRLVSCLLEGIDRSSWSEVIVWTAAETPSSHRFYESFGFALDGHTETVDYDGPVPIVRLTLPL